MSQSRVNFKGITPLNKIPKFIYSSPHNEVSPSFKLNLSRNRPGINKIISLDVDIKIESYKNLINSSSRKIVVNAIQYLDLVYLSHNNTVHKAKFSLPFQMSIMTNKSINNIQKILTYVTKLSIKMINSRSFYLNSSIVLASLLEKNTSQAVNTKKQSTQFNNRQLSPKKRLPSNIQVKNNMDYKHNHNYSYDNTYWSFASLLILVLIVLRNFCVFPSYF